MNPRYLGMAVITISLVVLASLFYLNNILSKQSLENCVEFCKLQKDSSCSIESCKANGQHNDHEKIISALELLVAFLAGLGFYLSLTKAEKIIEQKKYDITKLNSEEKKVFYFIKENKDKGVYQSNVVEHFNFPKSKVSRILDRLEQIGIIERKRRGMTNIIFLR